MLASGLVHGLLGGEAYEGHALLVGGDVAPKGDHNHLVRAVPRPVQDLGVITFDALCARAGFLAEDRR